jgi:hypothetical protein
MFFGIEFVHFRSPHFSCMPELTYLQPGMSDLRRLFLDNVDFDFDFDTISRITFPLLNLLSIVNVHFPNGSLAARCFPSIQHLIFDNRACELLSEDVSFFNRLAAQLHSFVLVSDVYSLHQSSFSSGTPGSVLINVPWNLWEEFARDVTAGVYNLRILVSDAYGGTAEPEEVGPTIDGIASRLSGHDQYPELECVYLPPFDSLPPEYAEKDTIAALKNLAIACQNRNIEVVFEEQPDKDKAESQISEEFMRRMTKKRLERETQE